MALAVVVQQQLSFHTILCVCVKAISVVEGLGLTLHVKIILMV